MQGTDRTLRKELAADPVHPAKQTHQDRYDPSTGKIKRVPVYAEALVAEETSQHVASLYTAVYADNAARAGWPVSAKPLANCTDRDAEATVVEGAKHVELVVEGARTYTVVRLTGEQAFALGARLVTASSGYEIAPE